MRGVTAGIALLLAMVMTAAGCARVAAPPVLPIGGDFTLTDHEGQPFDSQSLRGKVVLVFFGYTFCPDVCPTTLSKINAVYNRLGADREKVKTVYITVDPARDTPEVMKEHLGMFGMDAVGLTGSREAIDAVVKQYAAAYSIEETPESAAKYLVSHTTTLYALDAEGKTRLLFAYEAPVDEIVEGLRRIL